MLSSFELIGTTLPVLFPFYHQNVVNLYNFLAIYFTPVFPFLSVGLVLFLVLGFSLISLRAFPF